MYITSGLKARKRFEKSISTSEPTRKPYQASKWCRDMVNQIKRDTDSKGNYKPSGSFVNELEKKNKTKQPDKQISNLDTKQGGYY